MLGVDLIIKHLESDRGVKKQILRLDDRVQSILISLLMHTLAL